MEWTLTKIAGLVLVLGYFLPAIPGVFILARGGSMEAATAMFRDLSYAAGHVTSFKFHCAAYAAWAVFTLAGFVLFASSLWQQGQQTLAAMIVVFMALYCFIVVLEATFHFGVTAWAIELTESGEKIPDLYFRLRTWVNVHLQVFINPLAMLAFAGSGWAILRTSMLPTWSGWTMICWGLLFALFPLPLLIVPIPLFLGVLLVLKG